MKLYLHEYSLPLKHRFTIARESKSDVQTLIVELSDGRDCGFGEATCNDYYGATIENMKACLESVRPVVESFNPLVPPRLWQTVSQQLEGHSFALGALDEAAHDLWGKQHGIPLYRLWANPQEQRPESSYTLGIDSVAKMVAKLQEMPDWPVYKIKLGTADDLEIVQELRKHTKALFRIDANCGWTPDDAVLKSRELQPLGVEFIEQPVAADDYDGARYVFQHAAIPLIADESCVTEADVARCQNCFHGINIKLSKCGGFTPALRMIRQARDLGIKVMGGCMTESTVGISALAQLLPLLDYVDMDGATLLAKDIATGAVVDRGICYYPDRDGTGAQLTGGGGIV